MSKSLLVEIVAYLLRQKAIGRKTVFRTSIYAVMEDRFGWAADGRMLTVEGMQRAAESAGGVYINDNGRARVEFTQ